MQPSVSRHSALYAAARVFRTAMHLAVLAGSCVLVFMITVDCLRNVSFLADDRYLHVQFWICLLFMADIILDFFFTRRKWHYLLANLFFFVICIPYLNIINAVGLKLSGEWMFVLRVVPLVRAAFVLAFMTGSFSRARARSMLTAYLALLLMVVYFSSVMFFVEEHAVFPFGHLLGCDEHDDHWLPDRGDDRNRKSPRGLVVGHGAYPVSCVYGLCDGLCRRRTAVVECGCLVRFDSAFRSFDTTFRTSAHGEDILVVAYGLAVRFAFAFQCQTHQAFHKGIETKTACFP